jgi:2-polyprenyl-6-methoxyphenol hydroxylase-like FAD-dependent oxidoreductase
MATVLICGAGIAGTTLAYWLGRYGFQATVVERSGGVRSSGNPVDVRGPAMQLAERMGIVAQLREAATRTTGVRLIDASGRQVARVRMGNAGGAGSEIEIPRNDLAATLHDAARDCTEFLFGDTISELRQDKGGVDVTFDRAPPRRFDLVIGADGLHSAVRRMTFGPESHHVRHLGMYIATLPLGASADTGTDVVLFNTPGRLVATHPNRHEPGAAFIFRAPMLAGLDYRDTAQHRRIVARAYATTGWRTPELLARLNEVDDFYFDAVSKVFLPSWSNGRIVLLGDAASCVSLFGEGSSHAIVGAHTLANALANNATHSAAFSQYEREHRRVVGPKLRTAGLTASILVPKSRLGITTRNLVARALR